MIQRPGKFVFTKVLLKTPLLGALQVRYMPLALSLNSDCLVTALYITKSHTWQRPFLPNMHFSVPVQLPTAFGTRAVHSSRYFCSCDTGHGKTHEEKKKKKRREIPSWQAVHLCRVGTNLSEAVLVLSNAGAQGGSQKELAAHRTRSRGEREGGREAHTWTAAWLDIPSQPCHCPAPTGQAASMGHGSTHNPAVVESVFCYKSKEKKKPILITKIFKSLSISNAETKCNELLCFHIL